MTITITITITCRFDTVANSSPHVRVLRVCLLCVLAVLLANEYFTQDRLAYECCPQITAY